MVEVTEMCIRDSPNTYAQILKLPQFRDADAGLDFHGTGKILTPFGAEVIINTNIAAVSYTHLKAGKA